MDEMIHIHEMIPILYQWLLAKYTSVKSFAFWNVSVNLYNFRVPVYKGVSLPWMKWNPNFNDGCCTSRKTSFLCKESVKLYNFRIPVIRRFPFHVWNDTHPFTMTAGQVDVSNFSLSEKLVLKYTTLGYTHIRGFTSQGWNDTHPWNDSYLLTMTAG